MQERLKKITCRSHENKVVCLSAISWWSIGRGISGIFCTNGKPNESIIFMHFDSESKKDVVRHVGYSALRVQGTFDFPPRESIEFRALCVYWVSVLFWGGLRCKTRYHRPEIKVALYKSIFKLSSYRKAFLIWEPGRKRWQTNRWSHYLAS